METPGVWYCIFSLKGPFRNPLKGLQWETLEHIFKGEKEVPLNEGDLNNWFDLIQLHSDLLSVRLIKHILTTMSSGYVSLEKEPSSNMTS